MQSSGRTPSRKTPRIKTKKKTQTEVLQSSLQPCVISNPPSVYVLYAGAAQSTLCSLPFVLQFWGNNPCYWADFFYRIYSVSFMQPFWQNAAVVVSIRLHCFVVTCPGFVTKQSAEISWSVDETPSIKHSHYIRKKIHKIKQFTSSVTSSIKVWKLLKFSFIKYAYL